MKHKVNKMFLSFEMEEKWINNMAALGLNFIDDAFARYLFEKGTPGEYIYRIELLKELPYHIESQQYLKFMEDAGIECVATYTRWVYFRKKASEGPFDLYSDYDSKIQHYRRILSLVCMVGLANLIIGIANVFIGFSTIQYIGFPLNVYTSSVNFLVVILFIPMVISYSRTIKRLVREKFIHE